MLEEHAATSLRPAGSPPFRGTAGVVCTRPDPDHAPELPTVEKAVERLHVAPEPVIVGDDDFAVGPCRRRQDALDATHGERQRSLAQDVLLPGEHAQHVRFMQVRRGGDDNCIERVGFVGFEQIIDVGEHIGDPQAVRQRARLGAIAVADRDQLHAAHLPE